MAKYESSVKQVPYSQGAVYGKVSDLSIYAHSGAVRGATLSYLTQPVFQNVEFTL